MRDKSRYAAGGAALTGLALILTTALGASGTAMAQRAADPSSMERSASGYTPSFTSPHVVADGLRTGRRSVRDKLRLAAARGMARGAGIAVAVIDSQIDAAHPDLKGAVVDRYDTTGTASEPHPHGTGIAGAIASRQDLSGVAPGAKIYGIRVFAAHGASAETTSHNIVRGLEWAVNHNVRVVNMSFAGPRDPALERALKLAHDKGVILIAAVGNGGPHAQPLFPAASPYVIAVTATDMDDRLFKDANRGSHVAIAAPGVDILVPAPGGEYQVTTGTSIASAHISGVVALMLERNPTLAPSDVRRILTASAKRLGPSDLFGAGLVDPVRALEMVAAPRIAAVGVRTGDTLPVMR